MEEIARKSAGDARTTWLRPLDGSEPPQGSAQGRGKTRGRDRPVPWGQGLRPASGGPGSLDRLGLL